MAWKETGRGVVFPWHCDQFGHMNVRWYAHLFDDAAFGLWSVHGIGLRTMEARGFHTVVVRATTEFRREIAAGEMYVVESGFARVGTKSVTYAQQMLNADTGTLHATQDGVEVMFDPKTRGSLTIPDDIRAIVEANLVDLETA